MGVPPEKGAWVAQPEEGAGAVPPEVEAFCSARAPVPCPARSSHIEWYHKIFASPPVYDTLFFVFRKFFQRGRAPFMRTSSMKIFAVTNASS